MTLDKILPDVQEKYWLDKPAAVFPELEDDIETDVVIIGGGIAGLNTAYLLKQAGLRVAVLEKNTIGSGTTGGTTGKVTTQHGLIYNELLGRFGRKSAKAYSTISQQAFDKTRQIIKKEKIECDWQVEDNYVYTTKSDKVRQFKQEAKAAASLGLPASFETRASLPFEISGAVKFTSQAKFHSYKYVSALAKIINGNGSYVFEGSQAKNIKDGSVCTVKTQKGSVTSHGVVIATKVPPAPLFGRISYSAYIYPETSYIVAGAYKGNLNGMYISPDKGHYSLLQTGPSKDPLLLIGGENHIPGLGRSLANHRKLARYAQERFGIKTVKYRWKAMDYIAYDHLPIAGRLYHGSKNIYVVSGFKKWGLNLSMVTALTIRDMILHKKTTCSRLFYPHRKSAVVSIPKTLLSYIKP